METLDIFAFGPFQLLVGRRQLLRAGQPVPLGARAFDLLLALVQREGALASKTELMAEIWPRLVVEESNLHVQVSAVRKALGDGTEYLMNVPRRGYRFVARVERSRSAASVDKPSIAVLPFTVMSAEPNQDYFADGVVEEITAALSRFPALFVIARNSSFTYKGRQVGIRQIGRELNIRYVLQGSVRKSGARVRIASQLIETESGTHLWSTRYEARLDDVFELQDRITASVVGALVPKLEAAEIERALKKPTDSIDAYDRYFRALASFYEWTREGNDAALSLLGEAIEIDPRFVSAILLAENCWAARYAQSWSTDKEALAESARLAQLAAQLDPEHAEALAVLARRTPSINGDYAQAIDLAERAVALNSNSTFVWRCAGYAYMYAAQAERAVLHFEQALRLSPRDPRSYDAVNGLAFALIQLGRDAEAIESARTALRQNPDFAPAWRSLTAALALSGQLEEARRALARTMQLDPAFSIDGMTVRLGFSEPARTRLYEGWRQAGARQN